MPDIECRKEIRLVIVWNTCFDIKKGYDRKPSPLDGESVSKADERGEEIFGNKEKYKGIK